MKPNTVPYLATLDTNGKQRVCDLKSAVGEALQYRALAFQCGGWRVARAKGEAAIRFGNVPHSLCLNRAYVIMLVLFELVQSISCYCRCKK
jgi:hypothetical protein